MFVETATGDYRSLDDVIGISVERVALPAGIDQPPREYWSVVLERRTSSVMPSREYVGPEYRAEDDARDAAQQVVEAAGLVELAEPKGRGEGRHNTKD